MRDDLGTLCLELLLDECLMGYDDIVIVGIDLDDAELHRLADKLLEVADRTDVDLRAGEEGIDTEDIDQHTTLDTLVDVPGDGLLGLQCLLDALPGAVAHRILVREQGTTVLGLRLADVHLYLVTDLEILIVAELACGDDGGSAQTHVYLDLTLVHGDHLTGDDLVLVDVGDGLSVLLLLLLQLLS